MTITRSMLRRRMDWIWMAIGTSASTVVSFSFALVLAWTRSATTVSAFVGAITNGLLSKLLKKMLRQSRPTPTVANESETNTNKTTEATWKFGIGEEEGMPSSHSMSLGYVWTLAVLYSNPHEWWTASTNTMAGLFTSSPSYLVFISATFVYVLISVTYRINANLHTPLQVTVGLMLGMLHGWVFVHHFEEPWSKFLLTRTPLFQAEVKDGGGDDNNDEAAVRWLLLQPLLVIPFVVSFMIGVKADKRFMQWWLRIRRQKTKSV